MPTTPPPLCVTQVGGGYILALGNNNDDSPSTTTPSLIANISRGFCCSFLGDTSHHHLPCCKCEWRVMLCFAGWCWPPPLPPSLPMWREGSSMFFLVMMATIMMILNLETQTKHLKCPIWYNTSQRKVVRHSKLLLISRNDWRIDVKLFCSIWSDFERLQCFLRCCKVFWRFPRSQK